MQGTTFSKVSVTKNKYKRTTIEKQLKFFIILSTDISKSLYSFTLVSLIFLVLQLYARWKIIDALNYLSFVQQSIQRCILFFQRCFYIMQQGYFFRQKLQTFKHLRKHGKNFLLMQSSLYINPLKLATRFYRTSNIGIK